jgi:hypothetical protein
MMRISILLSFLFVLSITQVYAGAAEKWEYEPVMKNMNIEVKAHKVDQYGAAVNDYEYNTKIDPKTAANKTKMGKVGFGRLLRITGWGMLGYEALAGLLEAVDWVIDPEAQSIWRNKPQGGDGGVSDCNYRYSTGEKVIFFTGSYNINIENNCPFPAAEKLAKYVSEIGNTTYQGGIVFEPVLTNPLPQGNIMVKWNVKDNADNREYKMGAPLNTKPDPKPDSSPEKEYLTPEQLADYANHTHPDYSNPGLAPKLEPKYSPEIASDLWKPSNPWEETNSPTVQEVNKKLDEAQPEPKKDPEITPNPETGSWKLPPFCEIAAPVCDFIKWVKEPPESPESIDVPEKELDKKEIKKDLITANVRSCPADIKFDVQNLPFGIQVNKGVQMQPICDTIEPLKYVFQLITFVLCGFILLRV